MTETNKCPLRVYKGKHDEIKKDFCKSKCADYKKCPKWKGR